MYECLGCDGMVPDGSMTSVLRTLLNNPLGMPCIILFFICLFLIISHIPKK